MTPHSSSTERTPQIGDIYLMRFDGSQNEQSGWRPGLVFQNNTGNLHSPNIIALPLTSSLKKLGQPTHVFLPASQTGLRSDSVVLCENPWCVSKEKLGRYLTSLPRKYMCKVAIGHLLSTSAIAYLDLPALLAVWEKASALNAVSPA